MSLLEIADELYALPLGDFTVQRDARAKDLKQEDVELSKAVKALRKPSLAAWVANLLVRRDTEKVEQVLQVGAALREAQRTLSGDDLRALTRQRRQLTAAVTTQARSLARDEGQRVTEAVADQVEATLTAAMVDETCGRALRSGLLVAALAATGVEAADVAGAVALPEALTFEGRGFAASTREPPVLPRPELRVVPDPDADEKARAAAQEALDQAQEEVDDATTTRAEAASVVEELEARGLQLQARIDELRRQIADQEQESEELDEQLVEAEEGVVEADEALGEATRARDRARAALDRLRR